MKQSDNKSKRGGARTGAGNKTGNKRVAERRVQLSLSILPSVINAFKQKYPDDWNRKIEVLIIQNIKW